MWVSDKAIVLLTIAKHLPFFNLRFCGEIFTSLEKHLRTMEAFVSSIDLQLVFDSKDRHHYGPNYVISAQVLGYEGPFKV